MPHCANAAVLTDLLVRVQDLVEKMNSGCPPRLSSPTCGADGPTPEYILLRGVAGGNEVRLQKLGNVGGDRWVDTPETGGHSEWRLETFPPSSMGLPQSFAILRHGVGGPLKNRTIWDASLVGKTGLQDLDWVQTSFST